MNKEIEKLQGVWIITALEVEGQAMGAGAGSRIVVEGDRFTTAGMGPGYAGTVSVDPAKTPKTFDVLFTEGPHKGIASLGIYELEGDRWRICLGFAGRDRPKDFITTPGSGHALETLRRGTVSDAMVEAAPKPAGLEPAPEIEGEWAMVSCVMDGHPLMASMMKTARRVTKDNETTVSFGDEVYLKAWVRCDASKKPKTIDQIHTHGVQAGKTQAGIYEVNKGTLKVSFAAFGQARPTDFATAKGDGRTVAVWRRAV